MDERINIPIKAEERFVIQISFKGHNLRQKLQLIHDPMCFQNLRIRAISLPHKSTIRALFKAKSVDPKTYSPLSLTL